MRQILRKLTGKKGETLVESLCAILVFTLSSVAMYTMVMAAANINTTAKQTDMTIQNEMLVAEKAEGNGENGRITMTIYVGSETANSVGTVSVDVEVYRASQSGSLYSYFSNAGGNTYD